MKTTWAGWIPAQKGEKGGDMGQKFSEKVFLVVFFFTAIALVTFIEAVHLSKDDHDTAADQLAHDLKNR